jgi:hypothetical protein
MPRTRRPLGTEQSLARWSPAGELLALVATAPPVEGEAPPVEIVEVPPSTPPAERTPVDQTLPPPDGGIPFTVPAVVLEGWNTSDGGQDVRYIEPGSLGRLDLPQTVMAMLRNPDGGFGGHDAAIACGRIDTLTRVDFSAVVNRETGEPFGDGVWGWRATGYLVPNDDQPGSAVTADYVRDQVLRGVSADLREVDGEVDVLELDEDGYPERVRLRVTQGVIGQLTITPAGAFPSAYIILDGGLGEDNGAGPVTEVDPIGTSPDALRIITAGGGRRAIVAAGGIAPEQPSREWFQRQNQLNPSRHVYLGRLPDSTPTGQVWGYLAEWGVPHRGILDRAVYAPRLGPQGYRTFHTRGEPIRTQEGDLVEAGTLTFGGGHDNNMDHGVIPALAHYDNAGTAYADVVVGEDDFGVWFAGAMKPHLTRQQIEEFGRHPLSGDWRADPGDTEVRLVAALSVNTPGFEIGARAHIAASGARALVAAGSASIGRRATRQTGHDDDAVRRAVDERLRPVLQQAARAGLARLRRP